MILFIMLYKSNKLLLLFNTKLMEGNFKSIEKLWNKLNKFYKIYGVVLLFAIIIWLFEYYSYTHLPINYNPEEDILLVDWFTLIIWIIQFIFWILTFIYFLIFIYNTSKNIQKKYNTELIAWPWLSVWYFFIPILNLYKPYKVIQQIIEVLSKKIWKYTRLLNIWLILYLLTMMMTRFILKYQFDTWDNSYDSAQTIVYLISDILDFLEVVVNYMLVYVISYEYMKNFENISSIKDWQVNSIIENS